MPELRELLDGEDKVQFFDKTKFSMVTEEVEAHLAGSSTSSVVLMGIEVGALAADGGDRLR